MKVAHIKDGKIHNIAIHDEIPAGDYLDVSDIAANIGDEVYKGKVVSKNAVKDFNAAKEACLRNVRHEFKGCLVNQHKGFQIGRAYELANIHQYVEDVLNITNDNGLIQRFNSAADFQSVVKSLIDQYQSYAEDFYQQQEAILSCKSIKELQKLYPEVLKDIHPKAK